MIEIAGTSNGLVRPHTDAVEAPRNEVAVLRDTQRLCLAVLRAEWTTLAIVSAGPGAPGRTFSRALVETARACHLRTVKDLNAGGVAPTQLPELLDELEAARGGEGRALVTLEDPATSPASAPLVLAADRILLLVRIGASRLRSVSEIVELVGRERVIGCVLLR
jgi:hypothetical protein